MDFEECIRGRRSVRAYARDAVSDETVARVVDLARWSPSWANTQCVRILAVRDPDRKRLLAETLSPGNPATTAVREASVVVAFLAWKGQAGFKKGQPVDDRSWLLFDAGAAVQTFCLAAHGLGLGTVIVGFFDASKAAAILDVPDGVEVVALAPLGVPAKTGPPPRRKEVEELLSWERFQAPRD